MDKAHQILKSVFGYDSFRPLQKDVIDHVISGQDALVLMPTGGGKSICYQIPALMLEGVALVVSPLISLMKDQVDTLQANGIAADALNSSNEEYVNRIIQSRCQNGEIKILYISPERLMTEIPWLQQFVKISMIAIDEAHCVSQWGHDFRPEYTQLGVLEELFPGVPRIALTATADKITKADIVEQLRLNNPRIFISSFDRPNLSLDVRKAYRKRERLRTILDVINRHPNESGIIYCLSRKGTEDLAADLKSKGVDAGIYHAGLSSEERTRVQNEFINDRIHVICATVAFGMGIDKSNIRFVIHYNLPKSIESFYQEIGRGGRDGLPTETILFYNVQDLITLRGFAEESGQREINIEKLNRMQEYAEAQVCRRRILLNYFGEINECSCGNCDVCKNPPQHFDGSILVQKALSAIKRCNEEIGFTITVDVLKGSFSPTVLAKGYDKLKTFGVGRETENSMDSMSDEEMLFEKLRELRKTIANEIGKPAYIVLSDKSLYALASEKPTNLFQLGNTYGIGEHKKEQLGERFVDLICNHLAISRSPEPMASPIQSQAEDEDTEIIPVIKSGLSYMDRQKQLYSNAYAPWTEEEEQDLLFHYKQGKTISELIEIFQRNEGAIRSRLRKLGE